MPKVSNLLFTSLKSVSCDHRQPAKCGIPRDEQRTRAVDQRPNITMGRNQQSRLGVIFNYVVARAKPASRFDGLIQIGSTFGQNRLHVPLVVRRGP